MPEENRYGIEIDVDQIANARTAKRGYKSVHGDVQQVVPILTDVQARWPALILNPPYGLDWSDQSYFAGRPTNSCVLAFEYATRLMSLNGTGVMLCGATSKFEQIKDHLVGGPFGGTHVIVYAVLHVPDMFDNVQSQTDVILFGRQYDHLARSYESQGLPQHLDVRREDLAGLELATKLSRLQSTTTWTAWRTPPEQPSLLDGQLLHACDDFRNETHAGRP